MAKRGEESKGDYLWPITAESLFSPLLAKSMTAPKKREKARGREATATQAVIISNSQVLRRACLHRCDKLQHLVGEGSDAIRNSHRLSLLSLTVCSEALT